MKPVSPVIPDSREPEVRFAEHQPEYATLAAVRSEDGVVTSRWELTAEEVLHVISTRSIYLSVSTFNCPLQPVPP